ncbi:hypothetical protein HC174_15340 [Salinimicrobium sp. CDJ15-81-2]|nr:hypothetical protein [Salinimicrobium nanhaiense]
MTHKTNYIAILLLIIFFSCKNVMDPNISDLKKLDEVKTIELLTQIFEDEKDGFLSTNCLTQKKRALSPPMVEDFDGYVQRLIGIKDSAHYEFQSKLYQQFVLTENIAKGKKIITQSQFVEFERKSELGEFKFWDWLDKNCTSGFSSISKPIFNENFTVAYVQIGNTCGDLCGGGEERIYEYLNGKWIEKENLGSWIS